MCVGSNGRSSFGSRVYETPPARPISLNGSPCGMGNSATRLESTTVPNEPEVVP